MTNVSEWSVTAGLNVASPPDGWPEGMQRSAVNDTAREMMAAIARWYKDTNAFLISGGTAPAYTLTTSTGYTDLGDLGMLTFLAHAPTTATAATMNVDGLGAKSLVGRDGSNLWIGDIRTDSIIAVLYNGALDRFEMLNEVGDRPGTVKAFAGNLAPPGWLFSFGQSLLRADYPYLYGVIGTVHGAVDGTHFTLPDLRGRTTFFRDDMGGSTAFRLTNAISLNGTVLGAAGGDERAQDHYHDSGNLTGTGTGFGSGSTDLELDHTHPFSFSFSNGTYTTRGALFSADAGGIANTWSGTVGATNGTGSGSGTTNGAGGHTHTTSSTVNVNVALNAGGTDYALDSGFANMGGDWGNVPPGIILNGIIKT